MRFVVRRPIDSEEWPGRAFLVGVELDTDLPSSHLFSLPRDRARTLVASGHLRRAADTNEAERITRAMEWTAHEPGWRAEKTARRENREHG